MSEQRLDVFLTTRVGIGMLIFSVLVGTLTFVHSFNVAHQDAAEVQKHLAATVQLQAEVAAYARNQKIASEVIEGLLASPMVSAARIESTSGLSVESNNKPNTLLGESKLFPLYSPADRTEQVGVLVMHQNDLLVNETATHTAIRQTLLMLAQIVVAALVTLWVVRKKVVQPVARFADELRAIEPGSPQRLKSEDKQLARELIVLEHSANKLLDATEAALHDEREIRALQEISGRIARVGGWDYDPGSGVLKWGAEVYRIHERQPSQSITLNEAQGYYLADAPEKFQQALDQAVAEGVSFNLELPLRTDGGRQIWVRVQGQRVLATNERCRILGAVQDVTDRKQAEVEVRRAEQRMSVVFRTSPIAMAVARVNDGRFVEVNDAFLNLLGRQRRDVLGRTSIEAGYWASDAAREAWLSALQSTWELHKYEAKVRNAEGVELTVLMSSSRIEFAGEPCVVNFLFDVTEHRQMEQALQEYGQALEQKVEARTAAMQEALERLQHVREELVRSEARATLSTLIASVSHELNTPIGTSALMSSSIAERVKNFRSEFAAGGIRKSEFVAFLDELDGGSRLLQRNLMRADVLLRKFRQVAADQASEQRRSYDLQTVVKDVVDSMMPGLKRQPYRIEVEIPDGIAMDGYPGPLGQIIINLINNAYLHAFGGRSDGVLRITALSEIEGVRLTVADNGRGIAPEVLERIFEPFFSTRIGEGGTGLGMSIVDNLVRKILGGSIAVRSVQGVGTAVEIVLPVIAPLGDAIKD